MKDRTIQVLLITSVVFAVVIGILEFVNHRAERVRYRQSIVFDINPHSVKFMSFAGTNSVVQCKVDGNEWKVGDPQRGLGRADGAKVDKRIEYLNALRRGDTLTKKDLKKRDASARDFGLDAPQFTITIEDESVRRWVVGRITPDNRKVYVRELLPEGEVGEIFTVSRRLLDVIPKTVEELRSRILFPWSPAELQRVELRRTSGYVRVVKGDEGSWRIQQPIKVLADPGEFGVYLNQLCQLRIEEFEAENVPDLSVYGLQEEGSRQISLTSSDGETKTLVVGDSVSGRPGFVYAYRKDDTSVFIMRDEVLALLDKNEGQLRDARVLTIPLDEISHISISDQDQTARLSKAADGGWNVVGPVTWEADSLSATALMLWWERVVITNFDVQTSRADASLTVEFSSDSGETNRIEVLPILVGDGLLVRVNDEEVVHQINEPIVDKRVNSTRPLQYKSKRIFKFSKNRVNKLAIRPKGMTEQSIQLNEDGVFVSASTDGTFQVDEQILDRVLDQLSVLTTTRYVKYNPLSLSAYGLEEPLMEIYVGLSGTDELGRVLLVGNETEDGFFCMVKGRDVIFYLSRETVKEFAVRLLKEDGPSE